MALSITSGAEHVLHLVDAVVHPLHMEHPDWYSSVDLRSDQALITKRRLLDRATAEEALVLAYHFPFPGLGHVRQHGQGWRWQPVETSPLTGDGHGTGG
jgi:glyoxylase-like metal-dependent hydrolase (beta-lactamase superfamily II)